MRGAAASSNSIVFVHFLCTFCFFVFSLMYFKKLGCIENISHDISTLQMGILENASYLI